MGAPLRVGRIGFVNTLPVYGPLGRAPYLFELVEGPPAKLNRMLLAGGLDLASVSSFAYALDSEELLVLPGLCIASFGPVMSVRIFAHGPPEQWGVIELAPESATSVAMLRVILRRWGLSPKLVEESLAPGGAAKLLIGDRALRELGRWPYELDIAQAWAQLTGLPAVFGLWVIRKDVWRRRAREVQAVHRRLVEALGRGLGSLGYWAGVGARGSGLEEGLIRRYFRRLRWVLGDQELAGLLRFYQELADCGIISRPPKVRMAFK